MAEQSVVVIAASAAADVTSNVPAIVAVDVPVVADVVTVDSATVPVTIQQSNGEPPSVQKQPKKRKFETADDDGLGPSRTETKSTFEAIKDSDLLEEDESEWEESKLPDQDIKVWQGWVPIIFVRRRQLAIDERFCSRVEYRKVVKLMVQLSDLLDEIGETEEHPSYQFSRNCDIHVSVARKILRFLRGTLSKERLLNRVGNYDYDVETIDGKWPTPLKVNPATEASPPDSTTHLTQQESPPAPLAL